MLPAARRERLAEVTGAAPDSEAVMVVVDRAQDEYVLAVGAAGGDAARALVHVKEAWADSPSVPAADLAKLTIMEVAGKLTATQAKTVVAELIANGGGDAEVIAAEKGFEAMGADTLGPLVDQAIIENAEAWGKFCAGEGKAMGALVGAVMKLSQGKADGKAVTAVLNARREKA
jgi:aspartyl-tRNA(Asn)/glutamyl-tRNA(Gln) amidotransferase subunit B